MIGLTENFSGTVEGSADEEDKTQPGNTGNGKAKKTKSSPASGTRKTRKRTSDASNTATPPMKKKRPNARTPSTPKNNRKKALVDSPMVDGDLSNHDPLPGSGDPVQNTGDMDVDLNGDDIDLNEDEDPASPKEQQISGQASVADDNLGNPNLLPGSGDLVLNTKEMDVDLDGDEDLLQLLQPPALPKGVQLAGKASDGSEPTPQSNMAVDEHRKPSVEIDRPNASAPSFGAPPPTPSTTINTSLPPQTTGSRNEDSVDSWTNNDDLGVAVRTSNKIEKQLVSTIVTTPLLQETENTGIEDGAEIEEVDMDKSADEDEVEIDERTICRSACHLSELIEADAFRFSEPNLSVLKHMTNTGVDMALIGSVLPMMLEQQKHDWDSGAVTLEAIINGHVEGSADWMVAKVDQYLHLQDHHLRKWNFWLAGLWPKLEKLDQPDQARFFLHYGRKVLNLNHNDTDTKWQAACLLKNMNSLRYKGMSHVLQYLNKQTIYNFRKQSIDNYLPVLTVMETCLEFIDHVRNAVMKGRAAESKIKTIWQGAHSDMESELDLCDWRRFGVKWLGLDEYILDDPASGHIIVDDRSDQVILRTGFAIDYTRYLRPMRLETAIGPRGLGGKGPVVVVCVKPIPKGEILGMVPGTLLPSGALTEAERRISFPALPGLRLVPTANQFSGISGPATKQLRPNVAVAMDFHLSEIKNIGKGSREVRFFVVSIQKINPFTPLVALNTE
jgi:hypothetical protein